MRSAKITTTAANQASHHDKAVSRGEETMATGNAPQIIAHLLPSQLLLSYSEDVKLFFALAGKPDFPQLYLVIIKHYVTEP